MLHGICLVSMALHCNSSMRHCVWCHVFSQGEIFAAEGYAKTTGRVGVCIATSGPGATNLVTGLADAMMDSVPLVAITGQVRSSRQQQQRNTGSSCDAEADSRQSVLECICRSRVMAAGVWRCWPA
jgi:thiamine pyrophosphate-dependent acetolactate synthase large subunit-like protein